MNTTLRIGGTTRLMSCRECKIPTAVPAVGMMVEDEPTIVFGPYCDQHGGTKRANKEALLCLFADSF